MKHLLSNPFARSSALPVRSLLATFSILCCANLCATDHTIAAGETFNLSNAANTSYTDKVIANAGSIIEVPSSFNNGKDQIIRIKFEIAGAGVTLRFADTFTAPYLTAGIRATANDASLIVDCPGKLQIGRMLTAATDVNFPPVEIANMTFSNPSSTGLELYSCVTVRQLPTNCNIKVQNKATLALQGTNVLEPIGITNELTLTNWDVIALTASSLPQNCHVVVNAGRTFAFHPAGKSGWNWSSVGARTGIYDIFLADETARVLFRLGNNLVMRNMSAIYGTGKTVYSPHSKTGTFYSNGMTYIATVPESITNSVSPASATGRWTDKVAHWFDADKESSLGKLALANASLNFHTNGYPFLVGWEDARTGTSGTYLRTNNLWPNGTFDYQSRRLPFAVTNGLNGHTYISMGQAKTASASNENRYFSFWTGGTDDRSAADTGTATEFACPYAIMVFGSQNGGGKAILGSKNGNGNGILARYPVTTSGEWIDSTCAKGYSLYVDGTNSPPSKTTPNGDWQIVSLDMTGTNTVMAYMGAYRLDSSSYQIGGQNYAEVMFFSEKPTNSDRFACERYLAEKWGLTATWRHWSEDELTLSGNGRLYLKDIESSHVDDLQCDTITVSGSFAGTINVPPDRTMVIAPGANLSGATITNAGTIVSSDFRNLPSFAANYAGTLTGGGRMAFTIDSSVSTTMAADAIAINREIILDDTCHVTVTIANKAPGGIYTLLSATSLTGGTTLSATSTSSKYTVVPFIDGNVLKAEVFPDALMIILR